MGDRLEPLSTPHFTKAMAITNRQLRQEALPLETHTEGCLGADQPSAGTPHLIKATTTPNCKPLQ